MTALALMRLLPDNGKVAAAATVELEGQDVLALPESGMRAVRGGAHRHDLPGAGDQPRTR